LVKLGLEKALVTFYVARNQCEEIKAGIMAVQLPSVSYREFSPFLSVLFSIDTIMMHGAFLAKCLLIPMYKN
jgi:hypothetical protein